MKTVGNGRENLLTVTVPVLFCRERELRTGKQIRYYEISGTEHIDREHVDYDRENINYDREHDTCNHFIQLARHNSYNYVCITQNQSHIIKVTERQFRRPFEVGETTAHCLIALLAVY